MKHLHALPAGFVLQQRYKLGQVLGSGGFGIVYIAKDTRLERHVVVKEYIPSDLATRKPNDKMVVPKSEDDQRLYQWGLNRFLAEAKILGSLRHPNIVRVLDFFQLYNTAYLVMEDEGRHSLTSYLNEYKILEEDDVTGLLYPLMDALETVHSQGLLHRDIKPSNILLRDGDIRTPVLIDFGSARLIVGQKSRSMTSVISAGYSSIEQYSSEGRDQGPWSDIYSLGAVLYRCITGNKPAEATTRFFEDKMTPVSAVGRKRYSAVLLHAIDRCLELSKKTRPQNIQDLRALLQAQDVTDDMTDEALRTSNNPIINFVQKIFKPAEKEDSYYLYDNSTGHTTEKSNDIGEKIGAIDHSQRYEEEDEKGRCTWEILLLSLFAILASSIIFIFSFIKINSWWVTLGPLLFLWYPIWQKSSFCNITKLIGLLLSVMVVSFSMALLFYFGGDILLNIIVLSAMFVVLLLFLI